jgi:hypothetical protein
VRVSAANVRMSASAPRSICVVSVCAKSPNFVSGSPASGASATHTCVMPGLNGDIGRPVRGSSSRVRFVAHRCRNAA